MVSSILEAVEYLHSKVKKREKIVRIKYSQNWKEFCVNVSHTEFLPPMFELAANPQFVSQAYIAINSRSSDTDSVDDMKRAVMYQGAYNFWTKANDLIKKSFKNLKRNQRKKRQKELLEMLDYFNSDGVLRRILQSDPKLAELIMRAGLLNNSFNMEVLLFVEQKINSLKKAG